ncbi:hypothetical protein ABIA96_000600 [Bradyrhizobium sp. LB11.1]
MNPMDIPMSRVACMHDGFNNEFSEWSPEWDAHCYRELLLQA